LASVADPDFESGSSYDPGYGYSIFNYNDLRAEGFISSRISHYTSKENIKLSKTSNFFVFYYFRAVLVCLDRDLEIQLQYLLI
jgi:hypothetical protein